MLLFIHIGNLPDFVDFSVVNTLHVENLKGLETASVYLFIHVYMLMYIFTYIQNICDMCRKQTFYKHLLVYYVYNFTSVEDRPDICIMTMSFKGIADKQSMK